MKTIHLTLKLTEETEIDLFEIGKEKSGIKRNSDYIRYLITQAGRKVMQEEK